MRESTSALKGTPFSDYYFSEAELSKLLRRSTRQLRRWHAQRSGPPRITVGRLVLYRRTSVEAWLQKHEVGARLDHERSRLERARQ